MAAVVGRATASMNDGVMHLVLLEKKVEGWWVGFMIDGDGFFFFIAGSSCSSVVDGFRGSGQRHPWQQPWLTGDEGWVHVMHGSCRRWGLPAKQGQRQGQGETAAAAVEDDMGVAGSSGLAGEDEEVGSWVFCSSPEKMELLPVEMAWRQKELAACGFFVAAEFINFRCSRGC